jgi:cysteine-rich repeat protein
VEIIMLRTILGIAMSGCNVRFAVIDWIAVAVLSISSGACFFDTRTNVCELDGVILRCGAGQICSRKNAEFICVDVGSCGDGQLDPGEECDVGDLTDGDGCDSNCKLTGCGNGVLTQTPVMIEECDDGNKMEGDGCDSNCKPTGCGNGIVTTGEACDDGNSSNEDACLNNCISAICGDSYIQDNVENCDDGDKIKDACSYGKEACEVCDESCHLSPGAVSLCGDGIVQFPHENCDDGNISVCGTCSDDCQKFTLEKAIGQIDVIAAADINDINDPNDPAGGNHDTFTLDDGITGAVTFEFSKDGNVAAGNAPIMIQQSDPAAQVRSVMITEIEKTPLLIQVLTQGPSSIRLLHRLATGVGNKLIVDTVEHADFMVTGMAGGAGADCGPGVGCKASADCASNNCIGSTPTEPGTCH